MKVKAKDDFRYYRNQVLGLDIKDFRNLKAGKIVDISKDKIDEYPYLYEIVKEVRQEVKNGDKQ